MDPLPLGLVFNLLLPVTSVDAQCLGCVRKINGKNTSKRVHNLFLVDLFNLKLT